MKDFLLQIAIQVPVFIVVLLLVFAVLWRLRFLGAWTLLLFFVFEAAFVLLAHLLVPEAMRANSRRTAMPLTIGIGMGCGMPTAAMAYFHLDRWRKKRAARAEHR